MQYFPSDLAKILCIASNTIRRYEESNFLTPSRDENNYRYYNEFDITKTAFYRLYGKCGFTHNEMSQMFKNSDEAIKDLYQQKLDDLDSQIERLTRLRHWLKDYKILIDTAKTLDNEYIIRDRPPLKYITFTKGDKLLSEPKRLDAIKTVMYDAPEVQLIQVYKDFMTSKAPTVCAGWAIKVMDIDLFNMREFIETNPYIEDITEEKCIYFIHRIPQDDINDFDKVNAIKQHNLEKVFHYLDSSNYIANGDMVEFIINIIGDTVSIMGCIPICEKK